MNHDHEHDHHAHGGNEQPDHHAHDHHAHDHGGHSHTAVAGPGEDLVECPVMPGSMTVKTEAEAAGLVREYEGKTYYLCCDACGPMFDADPKKYAVA